MIYSERVLVFFCSAPAACRSSIEGRIKQRRNTPCLGMSIIYIYYVNPTSPYTFKIMSDMSEDRTYSRTEDIRSPQQRCTLQMSFMSLPVIFKVIQLCIYTLWFPAIKIKYLFGFVCFLLVDRTRYWVAQLQLRKTCVQSDMLVLKWLFVVR